jgi:ribosomal protein S18 acetylase RimI-like enzyme
MPEQYSIRSARQGDGPAVAAVFGQARAEMTYLPRLHTPEEDVAFFSEMVAGSQSAGYMVEVAESAVVAKVDGSGEGIVGFCAVRDGWLDHLYVSPRWQSQGIGSALLTRALAASPDGLRLWVFEQNARAQSLYARAGFTVVERTDGDRNEERTPDVLMRWP